jgi:hypothetical protein
MSHPIRNTRIGLISQWPSIKNAEYELIEKMKRTDGYDFRVVDYLGYDVETGEQLDSKSLDFAIDCPTYLAIINPVEYLLMRPDYAYGPAVNYLSHDFYAMAESATLVRHHLNNLIGEPTHKSNYPAFYLGVSRRDVQSPCSEFPYIFYCGINWERLRDPHGRHDGLFKQLDNKNILKIYGPEVFEGKRLWDGLNNYDGEIPFDGYSVVRRINECGICLVLSSDVHIASETVSSRIYEGCAAGAVIISDKNPFVVREFGSSVLYFDRTGNTSRDAAEIESLYKWIQDNPEKAAELAKQSQAIFLERFCLDIVLQSITEHHNSQKEISRIDAQTNPKVTIILRALHEKVLGLDDAIKSIAAQNYTNLEIIVLCNKLLISEISSNLNELQLSYRLIECDGFFEQTRLQRKGCYLAQAITEVTGKYVAVIEPSWKWQSDHISSLVVNAESTKSAIVFAGCFKGGHKEAPLDSTQIPRFFGTPVASDFEDKAEYVSLSTCLLNTNLLSENNLLLRMFEHYEALMLFIRAQAQHAKISFSSKFTSIQNTQLLTQSYKSKQPEKEDNTFWGKVSKKLGNKEFELKMIYDIVRNNQAIDNESREWLLEQVGIKQKSMRMIQQSTIHPASEKTPLNHFVEFCRHYPALYVVMRFFYRLIFKKKN